MGTTSKRQYVSLFMGSSKETLDRIHMVSCLGGTWTKGPALTCVSSWESEFADNSATLTTVSAGATTCLLVGAPSQLLAHLSLPFLVEEAAAPLPPLEVEEALLPNSGPRKLVVAGPVVPGFVFPPLQVHEVPNGLCHLSWHLP